MIELVPGRYVARIFYVEMAEPLGPGNILGYIWRDKDQKWQLFYRFRYYADDILTRDSKDRKSAYGGSCGGMPLDQIIERFRIVLNAASNFGEISELKIESDDPSVILDVLQKQPWAHVSVEKHAGQA